MIRKQIISAMAFVAVVLFFCVQTVWAHAYLNESTPRAEEQLTTVPTELNLLFTEAVETKLSLVELIGAAGESYILKNMNSETISNELRFEMPVISADVYRVVWQALSVDGHVTQGEYRFSFDVALPSVRPQEAIEIQSEGVWGEYAQPETPEVSLLATSRPLYKMPPTNRPSLRPSTIQQNEKFTDKQQLLEPTPKVMSLPSPSASSNNEHMHLSSHESPISIQTILRWTSWLGILLLVYPYVNWSRPLKMSRDV